MEIRMRANSAKYLPFVFQKSMVCCRQSVPMKGRTRRHERGAECGGREGAVRRAALTRTAKSCGPGAPMQRQALAKLQRRREGDGGKRWFTEEITYKS
jgi:hypothetical protein